MMMTFLDLLVVVFMGLAVLGLLAICLMFLVKNEVVKKIAFYLTVVLGIYVCSVAVRISYPLFPVQFGLGIVFGALAVAAFVLERLSKGDAKKITIARIIAAVSLVFGLINAIL